MARGHIIDISYSNNPKYVGSCDTPGYAYGLYVKGSYACVADEEGGIQVIDITIPKQDNAITITFLGDLDWDLDVDGSDLAAFAQNYMPGDCPLHDPCQLDLDNNNVVDNSNVDVFAINFGEVVI